MSQRKLIQTPSNALPSSAKTPASTKTSAIGTLPAEPFLIPSKKVRDGIIKTVTEKLANEPYAQRFIGHLKKIGTSKLDDYSDFEFLLKEFNITLRFETTSMVRNTMTYTLDNLDYNPDPTLVRTKWLGIF